MALRRSSLAFLIALLGASLAVADGGGGGSGGGADVGSSGDPDYAKAVQLIEGDRYAEAIPLLKTYAAKAPSDANAQNWLGYSLRKTGDLDGAFKHYGRALELDPKHRGAHEYVGEACLMVGNLPKAEEHLKILDKLCWLPCEEHGDLKKAIASFKANGNKVVAR
jgi:tetratricopeptide (TPR) repeat protein